MTVPFSLHLHDSQIDLAVRPLVASTPRIVGFCAHVYSLMTVPFSVHLDDSQTNLAVQASAHAMSEGIALGHFTVPAKLKTNVIQSVAGILWGTRMDLLNCPGRLGELVDQSGRVSTRLISQEPWTLTLMCTYLQGIQVE